MVLAASHSLTWSRVFLQTENARLKEENLQLQAKVDVLMSQLHGQVRWRVRHTCCA
jgi:hypothetical protein